MLKIEGFKEVFDILKELFSGVKSTLQIPENNRKEMREALADTAELVDETLTILKQHLTTVLSELKYGDKQKAKQMIFELGGFQGWETKFREFQMCDKLREATSNLERKGLYSLLTNISIKDTDTFKDKMFNYLSGETHAAGSVAIMLEDLSQLENEVDTDFSKVEKYLIGARDEVSKWRQAFIDLEKEIRDSI